MSNELRKGKRKVVKQQKKLTKKHMKEVRKILAELQDVAVSIVNNKEEVTQDNIVEVAEKYTDIEIGEYEKLILLSKLNNYIQ